VEILASLERVRVVEGHETIADHPRSFDRAQQIEDPLHVEALEAHKRAGRAHRALDRKGIGAVRVEQLEEPSGVLTGPNGIGKTTSAMEPNDLPIVCIPLQLPAEAAAELLEFLTHLTETIERHYFERVPSASSAAQRTEP
jgi:hypothetical protein